VSLSAQRTAITEACEQRGWELVDVVEDEDQSGATMKRPGVRRVVARLDADEADVLVVAKLDRISRSLKDFVNLADAAEASGWSLTALDAGFDTTTPQGRAVRSMLMVFAQLERELIGQRTKEALAEMAAHGVQLGRPREVDDGTIKRIRKLRGRGKKQRSYSEIARILNAEHVPTPRGGHWHPSSVRRVLGWDT